LALEVLGAAIRGHEVELLDMRFDPSIDTVVDGRVALLATAVGCPFRCTFCASWKATQGKYLTRSPEEIVDELASIEEEAVFFADDNRFRNVTRAERICELIRDRGIRKR